MMRSRRLVASGLFAVVVLAGAACSDGYDDDIDIDSSSEEGAGVVADPDTDASATVDAPAVDDPAVDDQAVDDAGSVDAGLLAFSADTIGGESIDASAFAGRDVVVWFWSPWCGSCNAEADGVGRVAAELGGDDGAVFLGVAGNADDDEYADFLDRHEPLSSFPQLVDDTGEIWLGFGADTIRSSFFFIDDTGETSVTGYGEIDEDQLRDRVESMIAS